MNPTQALLAFLALGVALGIYTSILASHYWGLPMSKRDGWRAIVLAVIFTLTGFWLIGCSVPLWKGTSGSPGYTNGAPAR